jgi:hypothetical protein
MPADEAGGQGGQRRKRRGGTKLPRVEVGSCRKIRCDPLHVRSCATVADLRSRPHLASRTLPFLIVCPSFSAPRSHSSTEFSFFTEFLFDRKPNSELTIRFQCRGALATSCPSRLGIHGVWVGTAIVMKLVTMFRLDWEGQARAGADPRHGGQQ